MCLMNHAAAAVGSGRLNTQVKPVQSVQSVQPRLRVAVTTPGERAEALAALLSKGERTPAARAELQRLLAARDRAAVVSCLLSGFEGDRALARGAAAMGIDLDEWREGLEEERRYRDEARSEREADSEREVAEAAAAAGAVVEAFAADA